MKNKKLMLGYFFTIAGFVILVLNALSNLPEINTGHSPVGAALLICIIGAVIISKNRKS